MTKRVNEGITLAVVPGRKLKYPPKSAIKINMTFFAHSLPKQSLSNWELMSDHEEQVAARCSAFLHQVASNFQNWGDLLGRLHDLGKYSSEFQSYLMQANNLGDPHQSDVLGRVDHSTAAAQFANQNLKPFGKALAYCFAGHHAGLPDWDDGSSQKGLKQRLEKQIPDALCNAPESLLMLPQLPPPTHFRKPSSNEEAAFSVVFWIRMMFSGLVDADFLATESFMSPDRGNQRPTNAISLVELKKTLERHLEQIQLSAPPSTVNNARKTVADDCLNQASLSPGFFSLCVPTGGGKTLAGLRFALSHATAHDLSRVIVAIPFTSIIEQNAEVYRNVFQEHGDEVVLEHHSNLDPDKETYTNRLQSENWDAPLVVTTNVQLFESLFATRTSSCRKLHRLSHSVIVLDEAQTIPVTLLKPTLLALRELVESYGCSVVLCTATQPALELREDFPIGIPNIQPIIEKPKQLHATLKRTKVELAGVQTIENLAQHLSEHEQALCIVNTRSQAAELFERLDSSCNDIFHLSTRMCGAHRISILKTIRKRLDKKQPCRVVSTQLIEAGVDVDFPIVFRAECGLDSLAQAAGRCNREGNMKVGRVVHFQFEDPPPPGFLRQTADSARELLSEFSDDLLSPEAIEKYFHLHYWKNETSWDQNDVLEPIGTQPSNMEFNFRCVAERYKFIRDETESVLVGWDDIGKSLVNLLDAPNAMLDRKTWRKMQRYSIQLRQHELMRFEKAGAIQKRHERWVLVMDHLYDKQLGLMIEKVDGVLPIDSLMS